MFRNEYLKDVLLSSFQPAIRVFHTDETVVMQGDDCPVMFFILRGSVRAIYLNQSSKECLVSLHYQYEMICEAAFIKGKPAMVSLYANEETELIEITHEIMAELISRYPWIVSKLMATMAEKIDCMVMGIDRLMSNDISERIARVLEKLAEDYGEKVADGTRIMLRLTDTEIGVFVGAKRETVNRALKKMRDDGFLKKESGHIILFNSVGTTA